MNKKLYPEESVQSIADAIRAKKNLQADKVGTMKIGEMASAISRIRLGLPIDISIHMQDGEWVRPSDWPDLDALTYGQNELYMTFDNSARVTNSHVSFYLAGAAYTVAIGEQTWTKAAGDKFEYAFTESDGEYPLVHVTASGDVTDFYFTSYTAADGRVYAARLNPMVERVGELADWSNTLWGTYYLEREKVGRRFCSRKSLSGLYSSCQSLQSLDVSGWNTTNWAVTSLQSAWSSCYSLQSLDLSGWNTTNWAVTSLQSAWSSCYSLQSLDLSGWDTTNWAVTTLYMTWYACNSLQSLDLSGWDTTNWAFKTINMSYTIARLFNCKKIDLSVIDMSKVTTIGFDDSWYRSFKGLLEDFTCGSNNYGKFNPTAYNYLYVECPRLTHESIIEMGKMLATVTTPHYFKLECGLAATLTTEEKEEITAKGWTIL